MTIPVPDEGLQPERTALSWTRTSLALMVCSLTLLRWSRAYPAVVFAAIALLAVLSVVLGGSNRRMYRMRAEDLSRETARPNLPGVAILTVMLTLFGAVGLGLLLVHR